MEHHAHWWYPVVHKETLGPRSAACCWLSLWSVGSACSWSLLCARCPLGARHLLWLLQWHGSKWLEFLKALAEISMKLLIPVPFFQTVLVSSLCWCSCLWKVFAFSLFTMLRGVLPGGSCITPKPPCTYLCLLRWNQQSAQALVMVVVNRLRQMEPVHHSGPPVSNSNQEQRYAGIYVVFCFKHQKTINTAETNLKVLKQWIAFAWLNSLACGIRGVSAGCKMDIVKLKKVNYFIKPCRAIEFKIKRSSFERQ